MATTTAASKAHSRTRRGAAWILAGALLVLGCNEADLCDLSGCPPAVSVALGGKTSSWDGAQVRITVSADRETLTQTDFRCELIDGQNCVSGSTEVAANVGLGDGDSIPMVEIQSTNPALDLDPDAEFEVDVVVTDGDGTIWEARVPLEYSVEYPGSCPECPRLTGAGSFG